MNWRIWHGTIKVSIDPKSLLRAEISKELLGADKTEITPSGIVPLVLLATVLSASYICMFISVLSSGNGEKDGINDWKKNQRNETGGRNVSGTACRSIVYEEVHDFCI